MGKVKVQYAPLDFEPARQQQEQHRAVCICFCATANPWRCMTIGTLPSTRCTSASKATLMRDTRTSTASRPWA
jgi:hypothetical protein